MKTIDCIELIQLADEGGVFTDESRYDIGTMTAVLNAARGYAIAEMYKQNNRVHPNFLQRVYPKYEKDLQQDDCYTIFELPKTVEINNQIDGLMYVGTIDGKNAFWKIRTRMQANSRRNHRIHTIAMDKHVHFLYDTTRGYLEVYDDKVKYLLAEGIFSDPTTIPGFNIEEDDYPITMNAMKRIEDMVRTGTIRDSIRIPVNKISNSAEDSNVQRDIKTK